MWLWLGGTAWRCDVLVFNDVKQDHMHPRYDRKGRKELYTNATDKLEKNADSWCLNLLPTAPH